MKLKSLILGSVAAAGLSTAGYAADLGVLTSLDVCDSLGLSGLTISSDTNCLQISGGVSYEFNYGDFRTEDAVARTFDGNRNVAIGNAPTDWTSKVEAWLRFVGTAPSDFGPAKAVIKLKEVDITRVNRGLGVTAAGAGQGIVVDADGEQDYTFIDEAYVAIGDTTVIMAGKKGSIANLSDDEPYNVLGLFNSDAIDGKGVGVDGDYSGLGGHVIQVTTDLGNGINASVGLENLNGSSLLTNNDPVVGGDAPFTHGTLVGVLSYSGETITAHVTGMAFGILDGNVETWAVHAGATGTFDAFKIRGAVAYWDNFKYTANDIVNALVSAQGNFDMFTIAASAEVANSNGALNYTDYGFGGSVGVNVSEGIALNLAARYFRDGLNNLDTTQVALQAVAAVTETLKLTAEVGAYFGNGVTRIDTVAVTPPEFNENIYYGSAKVSWAPGGGFSSELEGSANNAGAYKVTFKAAKSFE